jgi:hypothetical protein
MPRKESDIEIDNELRRYMVASLEKGESFNALNIDSVVDGSVRFISWMRFPVENNFMIFNTILNVSSSDNILKRNTPVKTLSVDKIVVSRLIFDYISYCDKNGVIIKDSKDLKK